MNHNRREQLTMTFLVVLFLFNSLKINIGLPSVRYTLLLQENNKK